MEIYTMKKNILKILFNGLIIACMVAFLILNNYAKIRVRSETSIAFLEFTLALPYVCFVFLIAHSVLIFFIEKNKILQYITFGVFGIGMILCLLFGISSLVLSCICVKDPYLYNSYDCVRALIPVSSTLIVFTGVAILLSFVKQKSDKSESFSQQIENIKQVNVDSFNALLELDASKEINKSIQLSATSNIGTGLWTMICFSFCNIFGRKSVRYDNKMKKLKNNALSQLLGQAASLNASAVTNIVYSVYGLSVVVSGTAVFYKE